MSARDVGLVLAGGGNRAFYGLGLLSRWWPQIAGRVRTLASSSAGACVALVHLSGRADETYDYWVERRSHVTKNFDWTELLRGRRPAPHAEIYRDTLLHCLAKGGFERVKAQPFPIRILTSRAAPGPVPVRLAAAFIAYRIEQQRHPGRLHSLWPRRLGFSPIVFDAREADTPEQLADWVLASSATPPFTPLGQSGKHVLVDGGLVDNAPAFLAEDDPAVRRTLVLMNKPHSGAGRQGSRLYITPTEAVPVDRWDYTRPDLLRSTITQGEEEAEHHSSALRRLLSD